MIYSDGFAYSIRNKNTVIFKNHNIDFNSENDNKEPNIYIQLDTDEKKSKLKESIRNIKKEIPNLFDKQNTDEDNLNYLIKEIFREGYRNTFYFTNASYTINDKKENREKEIRRLHLRPKKEGLFLQENIPDNLTLSFRGFIKIGFFVINEIVVRCECEGKKDYEREINIIPYHTNIPRGYRGNYLNELIDDSKSIIEYSTGNLENWKGYLLWRKEIVKRRLVGIKYMEYYYEYDYKKQSPYIVFHLFAPSKEDFDKIRKYLRIEDIKAFDNDYSKDSWKFNFNENNRSEKEAVDLGRFLRIIEERSIEETEYKKYEEEYKKLEKKKKKSKNEDDDIEPISESFSKNSYFVKIAFEIEEDYLDKIKKNIEENPDKNKTEVDILKDKMKLNKNGFLALSAVGDFALLRRLEYSISKLERDESYSPNLALWLFDIKKAEVPNIDDIKIDKWLNKGIENNKDQNLAVRKMLATKDVCLIQGPPGTGKTTVIAEAIYHFALRGESILLSSQTNLAVDNALERLAKEPVIRSVRLGVSKTMDDDTAYMTEDKVLKNFFSKISDKLKENYLNNWENNEKSLNNIEIYLRDINQYIEQKNHYSNKLKELLTQKENLNKNIEELKESIDEIKNKNNDINRIKKQIEFFNNFINNLIDGKNSEIDFTLPKDFVFIILNDIRNPLNLLNEMNLDRLNILKAYISEDMEDYILTSALKEICKNVYRFYDLASQVSKANNEFNPELELLKSKRDEIKDKMGVSDISDEEYDKLSIEFKKLNKEISNFKTDSFDFKDTYKALLPENIKDEYINSKNIDIIKNIVNKNIIEIDNIDKVLKNIKHYSDNYKSSLKEEDYIEKENQLKSMEGRKSVIEKDEIDTEKYLRDIDNKLENIKKENNIENNVNDSDIYKNLEQRRKNLSSIIEGSEDLKNKFVDFIKEFNYKLENIDINYENEYYKEIYINSCNVVGITCTANHRPLEYKGFNNFDVAIIDEVSKATPPELLIPELKVKKVILVGDHRQLPPLFGEHERTYKEMIDNIEDIDENKEVKEILTEENFKKYENMVTSSIFKEYFENANENIKHSLLSQFRMHSDIMQVINRFYENRLESGMTKEKENEEKAHLLEIKRTNNLSFITKDKHAYWIDSSSVKLPQSRETKIYESMINTSTSIYNILEAYISVELLKKIAAEYKKLNLGRQVQIGIISLYQLQANKIRDIINKERENKYDFSAVKIDVNVVDRFQGKEKEIVICCLVRNPESGKSHSKHITAFERINVAFSRAQNALFIIGAGEFYKNMEVEMPHIDRKGTTKRNVYRDIIFDLHSKSCFFESDCVIDTNKAEEIVNEYEKNHRNNRNNNRELNNDNKLGL